MNKAAEFRSGDGEDQEIVLRLLTAVEHDPTVTQRRIADEFGIALGLVNAYLKRCVKKGLIKINAVPARRYAYYLTPHGFAEKAKLTSRYLSHSFSFFRNARRECSDVFAECHDRGWSRVLLAGTGDLAEIMVLCASESGIKLCGVVEPKAPEGSMLVTVPVVADFNAANAVDAVVISALEDVEAVYARAVECFPRERVFVPKLLGFARQPVAPRDEAPGVMNPQDWTAG